MYLNLQFKAPDLNDLYFVSYSFGKIVLLALFKISGLLSFHITLILGQK